MKREDMRIGGQYNWRNQPERLIYLGRNWSGNGYWHQFELVDKPGSVWCEILDSDLKSIEDTKLATHLRLEAQQNQNTKEST